MLGFPEILIIVLVVGIVIFGIKREKIVELAKSLGRFGGEFKKGKMEVEKEIKDAENEVLKDDSIDNK